MLNKKYALYNEQRLTPSFYGISLLSSIMYDAAMLQSKDSLEELVTSGRVEVVVGHSAIELMSMLSLVYRRFTTCNSKSEKCKKHITTITDIVFVWSVCSKCTSTQRF